MIDEEHPTKAFSPIRWAFALLTAEAERVLQAWHRASKVKVLAPGVRGAEG